MHGSAANTRIIYKAYSYSFIKRKDSAGNSIAVNSNGNSPALHKLGKLGVVFPDKLLYTIKDG